MPWVSRSVWDATVRRAERAEDAYRLLVDRTLNPAPRKAHVPRTDEQAVGDRDQQFITRLIADLEAQGVPRPLADAEARRIQHETQTTILHPAG